MTSPSRASIVASAAENLTSVLAVADAHPAAALGEAYHGRTTPDVLTHLIAWHELFEEWIAADRDGRDVHFPAKGYTWETLAELNTALYERWKGTEFDSVRALLLASHGRVLELVNGMSEDELADPSRRDWTGGAPLGEIANECLGAHYEWALRVFEQAGLDA